MAHLMGERQRWAWLAAAWSIVTAACLCGLGWPWVVTGGLAAAWYYRIMEKRIPPAGLAAVYGSCGLVGKAALLLSWLWLVVLLAWSAAKMELAFPEVRSYPELSWLLLALAAWGSCKGSGACAGCSGVLCLILLVLYGVLAAFAVPDLKIEQLRPWGTWDQGVRTFGLCLLPAAIWFLPMSRERRRPCGKYTAVLALASGLLAAWTSGVLSPELAAVRRVPLYDLAQSVSVLGVMERIEPLLSAAMTMGLYALLSLLACACQEIGSRLYPWKWYGVSACILAGIVMAETDSWGTKPVIVGCVILWGLIPAFLVRSRNKMGQND